MAQQNSGYSSSEMLAMQRDAAERVREMQRRAQEKLRQSNETVAARENSFPSSEAAPVRTPAGKKETEESDRLMLAMLFLLLMGEKADPLLLLALAYIFW